MFSPLTILFPSITGRIRTTEKILFLTFDDGPVPEATPEVLDLLSAHSAKATFFCIGENIQKHPGIYKRLIVDGHLTGNHTQNHLNGWHTSTEVYLHNVDQCKKNIESGILSPVNPSLFRPPYGKLKPSQYMALKKKYQIVLWDVLTRDWETKRSAESCINRIKRKAVPGSIIVFHDSVKAKARMLPALEETLKYFGQTGYRFESLEKYC